MLRSLCWESAPWAGAGPATFESPQQWQQQQYTVTDTFLEKSFAQRAGLGEPEPLVCAASLDAGAGLGASHAVRGAAPTELPLPFPR